MLNGKQSVRLHLTFRSSRLCLNLFKRIKHFATVAHFLTRLKHNHTEYLPN
jgi:hypothetical protein